MNFQEAYCDGAASNIDWSIDSRSQKEAFVPFELGCKSMPYGIIQLSIRTIRLDFCSQKIKQTNGNKRTSKKTARIINKRGQPNIQLYEVLSVFVFMLFVAKNTDTTDYIAHTKYIKYAMPHAHARF